VSWCSNIGYGVAVGVAVADSAVVAVSGAKLQIFRTTTISAAMFGSLANSEAPICDAIFNASGQ
jgi:hypothetical protein